MSKFTLQIPRSYLAAVTRFAAKDDIRYYLNAVNVEVYANVAYLVGTDGHTLALARIERNAKADDGAMIGQGSAIIPREVLEKIKASGNHGMPILLHVDGAEFTLDDCGTKTSGRLVEGKFPDWRRVIPRKVSGEAQFIQPDYLARAKKAAQDLGSKNGFFSLGQNGNSAALVTFDAAPAVLVVIMPMRGEAVTEAPEWTGENPEAFGRLDEGEAIADHYCPDRIANPAAAHVLAIEEYAQRIVAEDMAAEYGPIAYASPAIAEAFGMEGIPNVRIMPDEPERLAA